VFIFAVSSLYKNLATSRAIVPGRASGEESPDSIEQCTARTAWVPVLRKDREQKVPQKITSTQLLGGGLKG